MVDYVLNPFQIPNNNDEIHDQDTCLQLSDLFNRLHTFTTQRGVVFTVTECQLDQVNLENIDHSTYFCYLKTIVSLKRYYICISL